jgi:hypothetical protein
MNRDFGQELNLLELKPRRKVEWEVAENGSVVLLVSKFRGRVLQKWLVPLLKRPKFRVRLDRIGSFIWQRCDGEAPVSEIAAALLSEFGPEVEPLYDRISRFLRKLEREELISIRHAPSSKNP